MSLPYPCLSRAFFPCHLIQAQESHEPSLLELAKLHLRRAELESCQKLCQGLLKVNENHEEASIMLADIMFRKDDVDVRDRRLKSSGSPSCLPLRMFVFAPLLSLVSFVILHGRQQKAMFHFQKLLERNPTHYQALYKLILLLKRAGKLSDAPRFIKLAERSSPRAENDPGFKFCKVGRPSLCQCFRTLILRAEGVECSPSARVVWLKLRAMPACVFVVRAWDGFVSVSIVPSVSMCVGERCLTGRPAPVQLRAPRSDPHPEPGAVLW